MEKTMKYDWMNQGQPFMLPRITVDVELQVLDYLAEHVKEKDKEKKQAYLEYAKTASILLQKIDKTVTMETVTGNLSIEELTSLYLTARLRNLKTFTCPHCKASIGFYELLASPAEPKDFPIIPEGSGTSGMKPTDSITPSSTSSSPTL